MSNICEGMVGFWRLGVSEDYRNWMVYVRIGFSMTTKKSTHIFKLKLNWRRKKSVAVRTDATRSI